MENYNYPQSYSEFVAIHKLDYKAHQEECVEWCMKQENQGQGTHQGTFGSPNPSLSGNQGSPNPSLSGERDVMEYPSGQVGCPHQMGQVGCPHHGGLIADEMGLGKTIQIIALIHINPFPSTLIVVPVALIEQWYEALTKFNSHTNHQTIIIYHGTHRKKNTSIMTSPTNKIATPLIVLTTYGEISRSKSRTDKSPASPIHTLKWSRVVFDEAHRLRNKKTNCHKAALQLSSQIKWLLTGTPIQNSRADFFALCSVIGIPPKLYTGETIDIKALVKDFIIKRTKKGLQIPMPKLNEHIIQVKWKDPYERELSKQLHSRIGLCQSETNTSTSRVKIPEFSAKIVDYLRARQFCIYPGLIKTALETAIEPPTNKQTDNDDDDTVSSSNTSVSDSVSEPLTTEEIKETREFIQTATNASSKLTAIIEHILTSLQNTNSDQYQPQRRKLVFCEFRKELDFLEYALKKHEILTGRIDGSTTKKLKESTIASPNIQVLLLQVRTCSEGLNLQQYSDIYIVTPQWNPTIEAQAICRVYRIGQQSSVVNVFRFVMEQDKDDFQDNMETRVIKSQQIKQEHTKILN